jgi:poly-gamma-glutamate synthesis protein (capsule biosynthesis protein)
MGDQLAGPMNDPRGAMGSAARFTFRPPAEGGKRWRVVRAEFVPYLIDLQPRVRLTDLAAPRPEGSARARAHRLIRAAVLSRGAAKDGLREGRPEGRSEGGAHH